MTSRRRRKAGTLCQTLAVSAVLATLTVLAVLWPTAGSAEFRSQIPVVCAPAVAITDALANQHGEVPAFRGIVGSNMGTLFLAPDGSWTLVVENPQGMACVYVGGQAWGAVDDAGTKAMPKGEPS
jgi:hypothetical protein